jgi:hypothetical protein
MTTLDSETAQVIRAVFQEGQLCVRAVNPTNGEVGFHVVSDVLRHNTPHKQMVRTVLTDGREVTSTVDHSLFRYTLEGITTVEAGTLQPGDLLAVVTGEGQDRKLAGAEIASVTLLPPEQFTYDLSVPGPENFVLTNGILAHNTYSIGGISLDLDKSSKYESAAQSANEQFNTMLEKAKMTVNVVRGLQQPRFGVGVRSSFGPFSGRGVLSPRKWAGQ